MFSNLFKSKKKPTCVLCGRFLTPEENAKNEIRFEHAEGESVLGSICNECADTLDRSDIISEVETDE
jgi:RNase P subunit RPR2